jgi:hypothetical protein
MRQHLQRAGVLASHIVDHLLPVEETYRDHEVFADAVRLAASAADTLREMLERMVREMP